MRLSSILNVMREVMFNQAFVVDFEDFKGGRACAFGSFGKGVKTLSDVEFSLALLICKPSAMA